MNRNARILLLLLLFALPGTEASAAPEKKAGTITPVPFNEVTLTGGFWADRMRTELDVTVPFSVSQCGPAVERFRRCAAYMRGEETELPEPHRFISSDLYKVMEGVAYSQRQCLDVLRGMALSRPKCSPAAEAEAARSGGRCWPMSMAAR